MRTKLKTKLYWIICLVYLLFSLNANSIVRDKVVYFSDIDGLPRNIVTCIEEDCYGYTWIGTANGISRYNGDVFKNYLELKGHNIRGLLLDNKNTLWVASEQGIYIFNRITDEFEIKYEGYVHSMCYYNNSVYFNTISKIFSFEDHAVKAILNKPNIRSFYVNSNGIYFGNGNEGIRIKGFDNVSISDDAILAGSVISIIREIDGHMFFGAENGQVYVYENNKRIRQLSIQNHHNIQEIIKVDNEYWVATDGNGIIVLDSNFAFKRSLTRRQALNPKLQSNSIYDLYLGRNNKVWIATYGAGLGCLMVVDSPFKTIVPEFGNKNSLIAKEAISVFEKGGKLFLGTNYGLSVLSENDNKFTNYPLPYFKKNIQGGKICALIADYDDNLWIGTYDGLLGKYTDDLRFVKSYSPSGEGSADMQRIIFIEPIGDKNLLVATNYRGRDLLNFDVETEEFTPIVYKVRGVKQKYLNVVSIRKNNAGEFVALLRRDGLFTVNTQKNILENNLPEINNRVTFRLIDFYQDKKGFYWLATQKDGLIRMSVDGKEFDKWTTEQGLPSNSLLRIESLGDEYLWISTISGLCRFDMETNEVLAFNHGHGLPSNEFTARSSYVTKDKKLVFGTYGGFVIVDPEKVGVISSENEVIISDITFQNKSIKGMSKSVLSKPLEETEEIVLPFKQNSFSIHFFTKDKDPSANSNYAYRLLGQEDEWIYLGKTKQTTYTNLSPGTYAFQIKVSSNGNFWNDAATQLKIEITRPWYLTMYAFAAYCIFLGSILLLGHRIYLNRIRLKKEIEMSEYKVSQEHELTERKLAFFTNISHDLKTPLTLIDAPVNDILESNNLPESERNKLLVVKRNSQRLYKLISDILDFRKLTQKQLPLKVAECRIDDAIENIYEAFRVECDKKEIDFHVNILVHESVYLEIKKIEKILWNLLSNAIKFTEREGEIYLSIEKEVHEAKNVLKLIVKDSGIGIPIGERKNIFNRFYQKSEEQRHTSDGTGIGLSIVKELVELHHGHIEVESALGVGSTFTVFVPVDKEEYSINEIASTTNIIEEYVKRPEYFDISPVEVDSGKKHHYNLPVLLIVEDNVELREYLSAYFSNKYKVCEAGDGVKALELIKRKKPDIIITDVSMPNMDGYEFCKTIRNNFETSHIPILMLTANSMVEQQIKGVSIGVDAYITKPFDIKYLNVLVKSTLENRKKIRNRIMGVNKFESCENELTQKDSEFIDELRSCIRNNISNPELNIELIAEHLSISRTQLNRKIKSLTSKTPTSLIKTMRLTMAYELISKKGLRVAEAAYQTGFSDPNYFTICFKKEFGENPSKIKVYNAAKDTENMN